MFPVGFNSLAWTAFAAFVLGAYAVLAIASGIAWWPYLWLAWKP